MPAPLYCPQLSPRTWYPFVHHHALLYSCRVGQPIVQHHGGRPIEHHHALLYSSVGPETGQIGDAQIESSLPGLRLNHIHLSTTNVPMHDVSTQCFNAPVPQCSCLDVSTSCFLLSLHLSSLDTLLANLHILEFSCTNILVSAVLVLALWKLDTGDPCSTHASQVLLNICCNVQRQPIKVALDDGSMVITTHITMCIRQYIAMATDVYEGMQEIYDGSL